jgi:hypothetical protein
MMHIMRIQINTCTSLLFLLLVPYSVSLADAGPGQYAVLDGKSMGHVRHIVEISRQMPGNWSYMYPQEGGQEFNDAYRYQLAFMTYTLALVQHSYVPAYRELYKNAISRLIRKMQRPEVWAYWKEVSIFTDFGNFSAPMREPSMDPVRHENIMYSGHLLMMVGLYAAIYGDDKYDDPGSIVFRSGSFFFPEEHRQTIKYDHTSLAETIYRQFVGNDYIGVACEPNLVFPMCNQHALLGLLAYDHTHDTNLQNVFSAHKEWYKELWVEPATRMYNIEVKLDKRTIRHQPGPDQYPVPLSWANGWTGMFMHAWDKEYVEKLYQYHIARDLPPLIDGTYAGFAEQNSSLNFGFTAAYAAEVGDKDAVEALLDIADKEFNPTFENGRFYYPRRDVIPEDEVYMLSAPKYIEGNDDYQVFNITGHSLLALARINPGDGFWNLFNNLPDDAHFLQPYISDVSYPEVLVEAARFDEKKKSLLVILAPGTDFRGRTSITVNNLSPHSTYGVQLNGLEAGILNAGKIEQQSDLLTWDDGRLKVGISITERQTLLIQQL